LGRKFLSHVYTFVCLKEKNKTSLRLPTPNLLISA
jgi:hypothetical protein